METAMAVPKLLHFPGKMKYFMLMILMLSVPALMISYWFFGTNFRTVFPPPLPMSFYVSDAVNNFSDTRNVWINPNGELRHRIEVHNSVIDNYRGILLRQQAKDWTDVNKSALQVVWGAHDDYFEKLKHHKSVMTFFLQWTNIQNTVSSGTWNSTIDTANLLIQNYYPWTGSVPLCSWIRAKGGTNMNYEVVYNFTCSTNIADNFQPSSADILTFHIKAVNNRLFYPKNGIVPSWYLTKVPEFVTYIHVATNAVITTNGDIISGNLKLVPYTCGQDTSNTCPSYERTPIYDEAFIITQYWGTAFFHKLLETMPRISHYLTFLKRNPSIKIVVPGVDSLLVKLFTILGLDPERAVTGMVRAKIAYMPRGTSCGFPLVQETQLFSHILRTHTETHLNPGKRNKLVLIKRSGLRRFLKHNEIRQVAVELSKQYGLEFAEWSDAPVLPLEDGMKLFHEAMFVVAPHGAGLSNLLFPQPGTFVIEGVCNRPHVNMCYQRTAYVLGHHYHAISSESPGGCEGFIDISPATMRSTLVQFLTFWNTTRNLPYTL